jgi:hypothetical protein
LCPSTSDRILKCHWQVINAPWDASEDSEDQIEQTQHKLNTIGPVSESAWKVCFGENLSGKKIEVRDKKEGQKRRKKSKHVT